MMEVKDRNITKRSIVTVVAVSLALLLVAGIIFFTVRFVLQNDTPEDESSDRPSESTTYQMESSEIDIEGPDNETDIDDLLNGI